MNSWTHHAWLRVEIHHSSCWYVLRFWKPICFFRRAINLRCWDSYSSNRKLENLDKTRSKSNLQYYVQKRRKKKTTTTVLFLTSLAINIIHGSSGGLHHHISGTECDDDIRTVVRVPRRSLQRTWRVRHIKQLGLCFVLLPKLRTNCALTCGQCQLSYKVCCLLCSLYPTNHFQSFITAIFRYPVCEGLMVALCYIITPTLCVIFVKFIWINLRVSIRSKS